MRPSRVASQGVAGCGAEVSEEAVSVPDSGCNIEGDGRKAGCVLIRNRQASMPCDLVKLQKPAGNRSKIRRAKKRPP